MGEWKNIIEKYGTKIKFNLLVFGRWTLLSILIGLGVGLLGSAFYHGMQYVTSFRQAHPVLLFGLPFAGVLIVWLYHITHRDYDKGTNTVLSAIRSQEEIPIAVAPLIFICTILTHLFGGSAGREGAALQLGGSIGNWLGNRFHMGKKDINVVIMCGMSAAFSAVFGTPMAAAFFSMEVVSVGIMYYAALVPCVFASLIAFEVAQWTGVRPEAMTIVEIPELTMVSGGKIVVLAILCAAVSVLFCILLHMTASKGKKWIPNPYLRVLFGGGLIILLTIILGTNDYLGAGMDIIEKAVNGEVRYEAFLIKMIFTALTLGVGYKGGEIVPSFFVGATFGCQMGMLMGISPSLCAAVGMIAVFCGVTNSPITSLLIAIELFGMGAEPYFLIGIAVSYMLSGYYGLYQSQKIVYSKYKAEYLDRICH